MITLISTALLGIVAMVSEILGFRKWVWPILMIGIAATIGITISSWGDTREFYGMVMMDNTAIAFSVLLLSQVLIWFVLSREDYNRLSTKNDSDQYALILFASVGGLILVSYTHMSMLFLGIEILSIPAYILAGSNKKDLKSNESAIKYFLMGAFASAILLFGIALLYGATGSFDIARIADKVAADAYNPMMVTGLLMIIAGLSFKVSVVPFHFWAADVYEGAPTYITAFMATFIKTAAFVAFYRLFSVSFNSVAVIWGPVILLLGGVTILLGNLIGLVQPSLKRTIAYSGIAQAGYLLLSLLLVNGDGGVVLLVYLSGYSLATMTALSIIHKIEITKGNSLFESFKGLGMQQPWHAFVLSVCMISLAGIPLTAGFFGKFYLFYSLLKTDPTFIWIILLAILGSIISIYYYFKVIIAMFGEGFELKGQSPISVVSLWMHFIAVGGILILGILPNLIIDGISW
jgi:NADH-quinone oxidoreductase subunit N